MSQVVDAMSHGGRVLLLRYTAGRAGRADDAVVLSVNQAQALIIALRGAILIAERAGRCAAETRAQLSAIEAGAADPGAYNRARPKRGRRPAP